MDNNPPLPLPSGGSILFYPPLARITNTEGVVPVKITTDGHKVIEAKAESGPKLLIEAAEQNAMQLEFRIHEPTSYTMIYRFRLDDEGDPNNSIVILKLPSEVIISIRRFSTVCVGADAPQPISKNWLVKVTQKIFH